MWEYNAKLPGFQWPQRHTLTVRLADELRPEEMLNLVVSGKLEEVDKLDQEICPIVARVDFINSMLGDELINIVGSWQKGLMAPSIDENICFKFLKKYSRIIAYFINYTTLFAAIYCCLHYVIKWIMGLGITYLGEMTIIDTGEFVSLIIRSIAFCCVVYKTFQIVANIVFSSLRATSNNHTFNITNGDRVLSQKIEKRMKNKRFKIIANLILTFLFNICCNLVSNMIIG